MADLPTNYLDDILAVSMGGKRKFKITHENGSTEEVTLEDISDYDQVGSVFGAGDINRTNQAVNEKFDADDVVDPMLATEEGFAADAKLTGDALSELNKNLGKVDSNIYSRIGEIESNIKTILDSLDGKYSGTVTGTMSFGEVANNNGSVSRTVYFGKTFVNKPAVTVTKITNSVSEAQNSLSATISNITTTSCVIKITNSQSSTGYRAKDVMAYWSATG